jgi:hypothetical protein
MTLRHRLRVAWRRWRQRRPAVKPARDVEAQEIAEVEALIGRLEVAAMIGSTAAAARLATMMEDRVGQARRRMAAEALERVGARTRAITAEATL